MNLEIEILGIKPLTSNHAVKMTNRGGRTSKYKTDEYRAFELHAEINLAKYTKAFHDLNDFYDIKKHYLVVDYRFYIPLFTKAGLISKKSMDADNMIKQTQDVIFKNLAVDDSQIISVSSSKIDSNYYKIVCNIQIKDLSLIK